MQETGDRVVTATDGWERFGGGARPSLENWLTAPTNKWAFRHARELFWSERVRVGESSPLPGAPGYEPDRETVEYLQRNQTDALVVLSDGALAYEWYATGVRPDDRHMIFSCTKSVVGLVASVLIEEGLLDDNAPVSEYVPEVSHGGYSGVTVRHLLDMTADVEFVEDYDGPDVRAFRVAAGQLESPSTPGIQRFVVGLPSAGEPGRRMRYVSPTTDLVGWVCERVAGRPLADLVADHVWIPMGAEWEADLLIDRFGAARASGGLCAGARDMARIGHLLVREDLDGSLARAVRSVKQPGDLAAWAAGSLADLIPGAAYRSFWFQPPGDPDVYLAAGIYGQQIYVDVPRRVVIAQQASLPDAFDQESWSQTLPTFQRIARQIDAEGRRSRSSGHTQGESSARSG
jgi:CubicO group peptidase (beta-lactamase class C family)